MANIFIVSYLLLSGVLFHTLVSLEPNTRQPRNKWQQQGQCQNSLWTFAYLGTLRCFFYGGKFKHCYTLHWPMYKQHPKMLSMAVWMWRHVPLDVIKCFSVLNEKGHWCEGIIPTEKVYMPYDVDSKNLKKRTRCTVDIRLVYVYASMLAHARKYVLSSYCM